MFPHWCKSNFVHTFVLMDEFCYACVFVCEFLLVHMCMCLCVCWCIYTCIYMLVFALVLMCNFVSMFWCVHVGENVLVICFDAFLLVFPFCNGKSLHIFFGLTLYCSKRLTCST